MCGEEENEREQAQTVYAAAEVAGTEEREEEEAGPGKRRGK